MTTAREQAIEAAWDADDAWQDTNKHESIIVVHANAASDVWEPIVRDLIGAVDALGTSGWAPWMRDAYHRAKEALGE